MKRDLMFTTGEEAVYPRGSAKELVVPVGFFPTVAQKDLSWLVEIPVAKRMAIPGEFLE